MVEMEDPKLQSYILQEQKKSLAELKDSDHTLKTQLTAINLKMAVVEKKQDIAQEDINKLSVDMDEIKSILDKASGSKETKERIIKAFYAIASAGVVGDIFYHFVKNMVI